MPNMTPDQLRNMTKRDHVAHELRELQKMGIRVPAAAFAAVALIHADDFEYESVTRLTDMAISMVLA
jgi:hypothetical protein